MNTQHLDRLSANDIRGNFLPENHVIKPIKTINYGDTVIIRYLNPQLKKYPMTNYTSADNPIMLRVSSAEPIQIEPNKSLRVRTGVAIATGDTKYHMLRVGPTIGLYQLLGLRITSIYSNMSIAIDEEICVLLHNDGSEPVTLRFGDKIAQLNLIPRAVRLEIIE